MSSIYQVLFERNSDIFNFQVFYYLSSQHLEELSQWTEDAPLIQIGNSGFNSFTQTDFLTQYEKNLQLEVKTKKKSKSILKKKVNFCDTSCIDYRDTRAFFLTPLKKKKENEQKKIDFKTICKVL